MTKLLLSIGEILHGRFDILIKCGSILVVNDLLFLPLVTWEVKFHSGQLLCGVDGVLRVGDVFVLAEVRHEVIDLVATVLVLMQVLGATGRVADWIGLEFDGRCGAHESEGDN